MTTPPSFIATAAQVSLSQQCTIKRWKRATTPLPHHPSRTLPTCVRPRPRARLPPRLPDAARRLASTLTAPFLRALRRRLDGGDDDSAGLPGADVKYVKDTQTDEWQSLADEFERRPPGESVRAHELPQRRKSHVNPAQFEMLPYVQSAFMAALTINLWTMGRVFRMDALLLLMYPLPNMFIAARWGLPHADRTLQATVLMMFILMGPIYAQLYFFNSGLLTLAYTRALWYRLPWRATLALGALAKAVGLALNLAWLSVVFRYNSWTLLTNQVRSLLVTTLGLISKLPLMPVLAHPSMMQVQLGIIMLIVIHSLYHVFCTLLISALMLIKVSENVDLVRMPTELPFIIRLLRRKARRRR